MGHMRVPYNSAQPVQLSALAHSQGSRIHLAPGQKPQLPHVSWQVVQQTQGRVRPTAQAKGVDINDVAALEHETDIMVTTATQAPSFAPAIDRARNQEAPSPAHEVLPRDADTTATLQRRRFADPSYRSVVQRRDMRAVMIDQHAREKKVAAKSSERYTTVGFEWDIAELTAHSDAHPNVLQGLTHVELAESTQTWNGLPYFLETDAGNVLEFVTPPFYVKTAGPETTLPEVTDLNDIVDSTRESLAAAAPPNRTLRDVMTAAEWTRFALGAWTPNLPRVDWHNWSPRAQTEDGIQQGLGAWQDITVAQSTLKKNPQINIAVRPVDYALAQSSGESRLGKRDDYVKDVLSIEKKLRDYVASRAMKLEFENEEQTRRVGLVVDQAVRVMAQQPIVPLILELAEQQQLGYDGQDVTRAFGRVSGAPSYIKDTGVVWLKTDLFTFAASVLRGGDWAKLTGPKGVLATMKHELDKATLGKSGAGTRKAIDKVPMTAILDGLLGHATALTKVEGEDESTRGKAREAYILELLKKIGAARPEFNEHDRTILGVRQDTFIAPFTMAKLSSRLRLGGLLSVMEVRNTEEFLSWLGSGAKKSKKPLDSEDIDEAPPAPIQNATLLPNVTVGDGNCFFHALHESQNGTRSTTTLQGQIRQNVVNALTQRNDICISHFGPLGNQSAEFNHFAAEMLAEGAWISDQTPAIVSDALNMRICIHNPDGTVYFDAVPNSAFPHQQAVVTVHVMYTGNHYNSYTNPAL